MAQGVGCMAQRVGCMAQGAGMLVQIVDVDCIREAPRGFSNFESYPHSRLQVCFEKSTCPSAIVFEALYGKLWSRYTQILGAVTDR